LLRGLCCAAVFVCAAAVAQEPEPKYRLTVETPSKELRAMLERGLQLARWQNDAQMTPELLRRLADEAVTEARGSLAAQGYFSATVSYSIDRDRMPWAVTLHVDPGPRTTVRSFEIHLTGAAAGDPEAASTLRQLRRDSRRHTRCPSLPRRPVHQPGRRPCPFVR